MKVFPKDEIRHDVLDPQDSSLACDFVFGIAFGGSGDDESERRSTRDQLRRLHALRIGTCSKY